MGRSNSEIKTPLKMTQGFGDAVKKGLKDGQDGGARLHGSGGAEEMADHALVADRLRAIARVSATSPCGVEVACMLT